MKRSPISGVRSASAIALLTLAFGLGGCAAGKNDTENPRLDGAGDQQLSFQDARLEGAPPPPPPDQGKPPADLPTPVVVTVVAPAGGESFAAGSSQQITWTASGTVTTVTIELLKGGTKVATVATKQPAGGQLSWTVDPARPAGDDYRIRVVDEGQSGASGTSAADFAITNWLYRRALTIDTASIGQPLTDYPVAVRLTPTTFDYSHARPDGADIRVSSLKTVGSFDRELWIESWDPKGESLIWVLVPKLEPNTPLELSLFYGNAAITSSPSDQQKVFKTSFVSSGNLSLSGTQVYSWFQLQAGHTLALKAGQALRIEAQKIVIDGVIDGKGEGHAGGAKSQAGAGPGGGGLGKTAGGGGGGYGGAGGAGGYDSGDTRGAAGAQNGQPSVQDIAQGSGGAGSAATSGGDGGGSLTLVAETIEIKGTINVDGAAGLGGQAQCGGGGAGGGVLMLAYDATLSGSISARGGQGGDGGASYEDGGGGGGGGRVKVFRQGTYARSGTIHVEGGAGGKYGDLSPGQPGKIGTTYDATAPYTRLAITVGAEGAPDPPAP